ncbi:hypothetical protein JNUCC0626_01125 [Lentzea sp. JNUCC 0626]|uniref:hypothetical protein n=1 Tax=Lentzea sp. JNUCC 0626 TaxID=3367513 RepID=UPI003747C345
MDLVAGLAAFLSLPLTLAAFTWYARRARRTGSGQSLMAPFEEIWDPVAHRTNVEVHAEAQKTPETPAPGDPPQGESPGTK